MIKPKFDPYIISKVLSQNLFKIPNAGPGKRFMPLSFRTQRLSLLKIILIGTTFSSFNIFHTENIIEEESEF